MPLVESVGPMSHQPDHIKYKTSFGARIACSVEYTVYRPSFVYDKVSLVPGRIFFTYKLSQCFLTRKERRKRLKKERKEEGKEER